MRQNNKSGGTSPKLPGAPGGRAASKKDKNGLPIPVRADRDRFIQWFFESVPPADLNEALMVSGDDRRIDQALGGDSYVSM
jgi:hypothetical protein